MKFIISLFLILLLSDSVFSQDKYESGMKINLAKMDECKNSNDYLKVSNSFERIAIAEKDKWLPYYYSALNCVLASYIDSSKTTKDIYLNKADKYINAADSLAPENSEIYTLKGMLRHVCRLIL
jgi:phosphoglycerol transferase MdoB-like AlkP superfamily enzyme